MSQLTDHQPYTDDAGTGFPGETGARPAEQPTNSPLDDKAAPDDETTLDEDDDLVVAEPAHAGQTPAEPVAVQADPAATPATGNAPLLAGTDLERRWQLVQASFVDEPRKAVADADALTAETVQMLSEALDGKRSGLGDGWNASEPDTESLRVALRGYRELFRHLLTV